MGGVAKTSPPRASRLASEMVVYLRHSGEAELGTGLFIFHTFPPNPFQRVLRTPEINFPGPPKTHSPSAHSHLCGREAGWGGMKGEERRREGGIGRMDT